MIEATPARRLLHTRNVICRGFLRGDGDFEVEAYVQDISAEGTQLLLKSVPAGGLIHEMQIIVIFDQNLVIRKITATSTATPSADCPQAALVYEKLEGLKIGSGFMRAVKERIPTLSGCTHLTELLRPIATTARCLSR